jgi:hypothetical protein
MYTVYNILVYFLYGLTASPLTDSVRMAPQGRHRHLLCMACGTREEPKRLSPKLMKVKSLVLGPQRSHEIFARHQTQKSAKMPSALNTLKSQNQYTSMIIFYPKILFFNTSWHYGSVLLNTSNRKILGPEEKWRIVISVSLYYNKYIIRHYICTEPR